MIALRKREPPAVDLVAELRDAEPALLATARRLCADAAEARELVHDVIEHTLRQAEREEPGDLSAWLTAAMHACFVERCGARARRAAAAERGDAGPAPIPIERPGEEPAWSRISAADLRAAVDELDPPLRDVYVLHGFEHHSYDEIAARLGLPRLTVGIRLGRARRRLRDILIRRVGRADGE